VNEGIKPSAITRSQPNEQPYKIDRGGKIKGDLDENGDLAPK
jgi:hypothetical protein